MTPAPGPERRYRGPHAQVVHLIDPADAGLPTRAALCGVEDDVDNWHGTGSQAEYLVAMALPVCGRCQAASS